MTRRADSDGRPEHRQAGRLPPPQAIANAVRGDAGRSVSRVSQVERGVKPLDRLSVLCEVARVLEVAPADLLPEELLPARKLAARPPTVAEALSADPKLSPAARDLLLSVYRFAVLRDVGDGDQPSLSFFARRRSPARCAGLVRADHLGATDDRRVIVDRATDLTGQHHNAQSGL